MNLKKGKKVKKHDRTNLKDTKTSLHGNVKKCPLIRVQFHIKIPKYLILGDFSSEWIELHCLSLFSTFKVFGHTVPIATFFIVIM